MSAHPQFRKKSISPDAVAAVEAAAAGSPIIGDPRIGGGAVPGAVPGVSSGVAPPAFTELLTVPGPGPGLGASQALQSYSVGAVVEMPLSRIKSNPMNPRVVYTATAVDEMATSLSKNGQRVAALGYINDSGFCVLIEGETRLRGARAAGLEALRVEIRPQPADDRELYEQARAANVERRDQTPLDDALRWRDLLEKKVYASQAALARALDLREDLVSRTLSLAALPMRIITAAAESRDMMNLRVLNAVREYWEALGDDAALALIQEVERAGLGYRDITSRRIAAQRGPITRARSDISKIAFKGGKGEIRTFEKEGRVELSLKGLSSQDLDALAAQLRALLTGG